MTRNRGLCWRDAVGDGKCVDLVWVWSDCASEGWAIMVL